MKTLKEYKRLQAEAQRAQTKYDRAVLALRDETSQAAKRMEEASRVWRSNPSPKNRQKMLQAKKQWSERLKILETLLGHLFAK